MRVLLSMLCMLVAFNAYAGDKYEEKANPNWKIDRQLTKFDPVYIKVSDKVKVFSFRKFKTEYNMAMQRLFKFEAANVGQCKIDPLEIRVVTERDLNNEKFFPYEGSYTFTRNNGKTTFIIGRYFPLSNTLYIVPHVPNDGSEWVNWEAYFAHEVAHYFYDDCEMTFPGDPDAHNRIDKFTRKYYRR